MGLDTLLRALDLVRRRGHKLRTFIAGEGSQRVRLEMLRRHLNLESEVTFMGFVPGASLPLAYGACDASLIPTQALECFGIIALESLACGRPTLVTPVGALPEVVNGFEPRWVARDSTPEQIADVLCAFLGGRLPARSAEELRERLTDQYGFARALRTYGQILGLQRFVEQEA
jgi:glycosyltransferase involved in cell wall biosynthesis